MTVIQKLALGATALLILGLAWDAVSSRRQTERLRRAVLVLGDSASIRIQKAEARLDSVQKVSESRLRAEAESRARAERAATEARRRWEGLLQRPVPDTCRPLLAEAQVVIDSLESALRETRSGSDSLRSGLSLAQAEVAALSGELARARTEIDILRAVSSVRPRGTTHPLLPQVVIGVHIVQDLSTHRIAAGPGIGLGWRIPL